MKVRLSAKMLISSAACMVATFAVIYAAYLTHRNFEDIVVSQTQLQLLSTAKATARSLKQFIEEHSKVLKFSSMNPLYQESIRSGITQEEPDHTFCAVNNFFEAHQDDVNALTVLDAKGIVLHRHPFIKGLTGMDLTNKPGVAYVIREHKPYISRLFYNDLGNAAISISEPIFYDGKFTGIVRWMIEAATLSRRFLEPVKIGNNGYAWMFDDRNIILSHPRKDFMGVSVLDAIKKIHVEKGESLDDSIAQRRIDAELEYLNRVNSRKEGYGIFVDCAAEKEQIVSYTSLSLGEATFNIVATLPYSEIIGPIQKHARNTFGLAGLVILMMSGGGVLLFRSEKRKSELKVERKHLREIAQSAEALRRSERRFRELVDLLPQTVFEMDVNGNVTFSNRHGFGNYGYSQEDLDKGLNALQLFVPEDLDRLKENIENVLSGQEPEGNEYTAMRKDGSTFPVIAYSSRIISNGKPSGARGILIDITKRKQIEDKLRQSEERYRDLYEDAPIAYLSISAADGTVMRCNSQVEQLLGYDKKSTIGMKVFDLYADTPEGKTKAKKVFESFRRGQSVRDVELEMKHKNGGPVWVDLCLEPITNGDGNIVESRSMIIDITARKRAEKAAKRLQLKLQHAQKLESIGTLTSGVAHNFRNLLSPISLYSQLIQITYRDDPQLQEMARKSEECAKRGAQLVNGLMQFSRKHAKELEMINLAEVLRETHGIIVESFDKKVDIRMDVADSLPIRGDHSELSQVFMNLCTNARDAMPDGGNLSIEAVIEGDDALITISDTGIGMGEQTREQCFDPFFTTKEVDKGTGLGLSTTYGIVKDHGGEIQVFSELNKGTTFKIYIPLALSDEPTKQADAREILQGRGEKVLIIDDEAGILEALVILVERLGYRTATADNARAGLDKYKSWQPDVVLLDRNMPGMDGLGCARTILEYDPEARIVLISGYDKSGPSGIDKKTKALIKWYLTKPVDMEQLSETIRIVLDKD